MNKKITLLLTFLTLLIWNQSAAQCLIEDVELNERVQQSSLIIDGEVTKSEGFWSGGNIYTKHQVSVYQVFKGSLPAGGLEIITLGGTVGSDMLEVSPSLSLKVGMAGMLFLEKWKHNTAYFLPVFDAMGFVKYDKTDLVATDLFHNYGNINNAFLPQINQLVVEKSVVLSTPFYLEPKFGRRVNPTISSFTPTRISAGTDSSITISGTDFGATRGAGKVEFKNGNDGGISWVEAEVYVSWSNTSITVKVPTLAGTGTIRVTNNATDNSVSGQTLTIPYTHINAGLGGDPYYTQHIEVNGSNNDINWTFSQRFFDSTNAKDAFVRSLENWRCATFMPWNMQTAKTGIDQAVSDNVNVVTWDFNDTLPTNVLGRCYSRFSACPDGIGGFKVYVTELDIIFNNKKNWHYGLGNPPGSSFDFVSVASHELGHGHQLSHVIDPSKMMHYSIGNGQSKRTITTDDINGGNAVHARSVNAVCLETPLVLVNSNTCSLVATSPGFGVDRTDACLQETFVFSDSTKGAAITWLWNFGSGANPLTKTGIGPHAVTYNTSGKKTVSLTTTALSGPQVETKTDLITIKDDLRVKAQVKFANNGNNIFKFHSVNGTNYTNDWLYNSDADTLKDADTIFITFPQPGSYTIKLHAYNKCNDTTIVINLTDWTGVNLVEEKLIHIYPNPASDLLHIENLDQATIEKWMITDLSGKVIADEVFKNVESLDISFLQAGMYLFHFQIDGQNRTTKLIKQ